VGPAPGVGPTQTQPTAEPLPPEPSTDGAGARVGGGSSNYDDSITDKGSRYPNRETDVSATEFQANLVANGFTVVKQTVGSNGPVTILSNGQTTYTIYTATSTGSASAQATVNGKIVVKIRLGGP
jgi:filamentous hemagglutinin